MVKNRTLFTGDNLDILRGMNSASVDLVYLDPPFNSAKQYSAPVGSAAAGAAFKDTWTLDDVTEEEHVLLAETNAPAYEVIRSAGHAHSDSMKAYLVMMAVRLLELRRVMKDTASIYLHCDPYANSYLRVLMDGIFGKGSFRNEIAWCYTGPGNVRKHFPRKHDTLLFYAGDGAVFNLDDVRVPYSESTLARRRYDEGTTSLTGARRASRTEKEVAEEFGQGKVPEDWWTGFGSGSHMPKNERVGYPTQKPLALLDRIIRASSNPGDMVLDPFCGCATTCVAAEKLGRQWIGIDLSEKAYDLVKERLKRENKSLDLMPQLCPREDVPMRTDLGNIPHYRTHKKTLYGNQSGNCAGCRVHFEDRNLTIDHVIPRRKGGTDHLDNLQLLCGSCNSKKGSKPMAYLLARLKADMR